MIPLARPKFWRSINAISLALYPISLLVALYVACKKLCSTEKKVGIPVICIGNITIGGAGKTPLAIHLGRKLKDNGFKIAYISRGFGGTLSNKHEALKVDDSHTALQVGDEPLLLAMVAPTYICVDRYLAALKAEQNGAQVIIMDDGMQNHSLHKDITIMVVDADYAFGNKFLLPAGPLRQSVESGVRQADFIACIGNAEISIAEFMNKTFNRHIAKRGFSLRYYVQPNIASKLAKQCVIAMCSIASPEKFVATLEQTGATVLALHSFPDHHNYTEQELLDILQKAGEALVVTTSKDMVKIPKSLRSRFLVLEIELLDDNSLLNFLLAKIYLHHLK